MKRKYGDRANWQRILERSYAQAYINEKEFKGYITLIHMKKVSQPLVIHYEQGKQLSIVEDGFMWLQQFPDHEHFAVTTTFDANGNVKQWYIDIAWANGVEGGIPYVDDLYLDIVHLPSGETFMLDEEELQDALLTNEINRDMYNLAQNESIKIQEQIKNNSFSILSLVHQHMEYLKRRLD
ncbi:hypothetical conserved protein [Oceanobacillus iheyensis HTE831]|uniref:Hypothetical conserved protein n=1 Tax=Oceanobacillus iheyensis (strain DSM 14371 / CIP 107618 / JCM 11309 / KCTC 3954 / HTE831) TaxID=221109 RepID=Q8ETB2_OCEIH|nr:DUF402 domain-containing protein [Oceanobacillus iheyensis]BAC12305.1 hypothetical conserved protein [Oceanobacillus iheyensis HTE831]